MLNSDFSLEGVKSVLSLLNSRRQICLFLNSGETKILSAVHVENEVLTQLKAAAVALNEWQGQVDAGLVTVSKIAQLLDIAATTVGQVISTMVTHEASEFITVVTDTGDELVLNAEIMILLRERVTEAVRETASGRVKLAALCGGADTEGVGGHDDPASALLRALPLHFTVHSLLAPLLPAVTARCCVRVDGRFVDIFALLPADLAALGVGAVEVCTDRACAAALVEGCFAAYKQFCSSAARPADADADTGGDAAAAVVPPLELTAAVLGGLREEAAALVPDACTLRSLLQLSAERDASATPAAADVGLAKILIVFEHLISLADRNPYFVLLMGCELMERVVLHSSFLSARHRAVGALCRQTEGGLVVLDAQGPSTAAFLEKWWFRQQGKRSALLQFEQVARSCVADSGTEYSVLGGGRFLVRSHVLVKARDAVAAWLRTAETSAEGGPWWLDFAVVCGAVGGSSDSLAAAFDHVADMDMPDAGPCLRQVLATATARVCVVVDSGAPVLLWRVQVDLVVAAAMRALYTAHPQTVSASTDTGLPPRMVTGSIAAAAARVAAPTDGDVPIEALCAAAGPLLLGALQAARESYRRQWGQPEALLHPLTADTQDSFPALWRFSTSPRTYTVVSAAGAGGDWTADTRLALEGERDMHCLAAWNRILSLVCSASGSGRVPVGWLLPSSTVPGEDIYDVVDGGSSGDRALLQFLVLERLCVPFVFILTAYTCALNGVHCGALFRQQGHLGSLLTDYCSVCRYRPVSSLKVSSAAAVAAAWVEMQAAVWEDENTGVILNAEPLFSVLTTMWLLVLPTELRRAIDTHLDAQLAAEGASLHDPEALLATRAAVAAAPDTPSLWSFLGHVQRSVVPQLGLGILRQPETFDRLKKRERLALLQRDHLSPTAARSSLDAARACCLIADSANGCCSGEAAACCCAAVLFACNMFIDTTELLTSLVVCALAEASGMRRPRFALLSADCEGPFLGAGGLLDEGRPEGGEARPAASAMALAALCELHRCLRDIVVPARLAALRCLEARTGGSEDALRTALQLGDPCGAAAPGWEGAKAGTAAAGVYGALASLIQFVHAVDRGDSGGDAKGSKRRNRLKPSGKTVM